MNTPEPPREFWERRKLGIELRQKYELYFVALAFTLAGLSVQSAQKSGQCWDNLVEIGGWMALLGAGLVGLFRVSKLWRREVGVAEYQESQYPIGNSELWSELERVEALIRRLEKLQYGCLVLGILLLMISRGARLFLS